MAALAERGDLVGEQPHEMVIGRCQRSDDVVEPRLKTQWFVRTGPLAERALDATRTADADPARAVREDLGALADEHPRLERQRQLWWGHRIPAWYCPTATSRSRRRRRPERCEVGRPAPS